MQYCNAKGSKDSQFFDVATLLRASSGDAGVIWLMRVRHMVPPIIPNIGKDIPEKISPFCIIFVIYLIRFCCMQRTSLVFSG